MLIIESELDLGAAKGTDFLPTEPWIDAFDVHLVETGQGADRLALQHRLHAHWAIVFGDARRQFARRETFNLLLRQSGMVIGQIRPTL